MITINNVQTYNNLKSNFIDGIEFNRLPFETYCARKSFDPTLNAAEAAKINNHLFCDAVARSVADHSICSVGILDRSVTEKLVADKRNEERLINNGVALFKDTFTKGLQNPTECVKAWYDALAEYVSNIALNNIDKKPPLQIISEELSALTKSLGKNLNFVKAKQAVFDELKKRYPNDYKSYIKSCEQSYMETIQSTVNDIVKKIVKARGTV